MKECFKKKGVRIRLTRVGNVERMGVERMTQKWMGKRRR